jgi:hypothetical protein
MIPSPTSWVRITCIWSLWLCRNDLVFEKKNLFATLSGGLFGNPLATDMSYPPKVIRTGFGIEGIATIDASGYDVFLSGRWRSSLRINCH